MGTLQSASYIGHHHKSIDAMTDTKRRTIRNLIIFTLVVLASGWIGHTVNGFQYVPEDDNLGMLLWLVAPMVAMLVLRGFAGDGWSDMGIKPLLRTNTKWYLVSLLIFPVLTVLAVGVGVATGWITMARFDYNVFWSAFLLSLLPNFFKNIPEEFVWRGYLTPKLVSLKMGDFGIYLTVGLIWGVWHIPYYLYFLDQNSLNLFSTLPMTIFIPLTIVTMVAWTIVFTEIWFATKSVWPAVLMHMVEDAFVNPLIFNPGFQMSQDFELWIHPVIGVASILLYTIAGLGLRRNRLRNSA